MNIFEKISELSHENRAFVVATVVKASGSVPGKVGFKMIVESGGKSTGTVGGGEIEQRAVQECKDRMNTGASGMQEYILREKASANKREGDAEVIPMMCNGKVWIYYDVVNQQPSVYIFGGGHVGQALSFFLSKLNYQIILVDNREEFASESKNPYATKRVLDDYLKFSKTFEPQPNSIAVIMTHGHGYDYEILHLLYQRELPFRYIGVIASKSKSGQLINKLKNDLGSSIDLSNLYTPIGIDIGGSSESEIALSIAAEIQAVRNGKQISHLGKQ